ncbi:MAG: hypothetical protein I8H75_03790 [Myxococcaceae bacterium]|nr:hypothetical protein [Myxococcaceae bacterium]MBH2006449.1 hypothetical protein [Myxococcaceae bacterium]
MIKLLKNSVFFIILLLTACNPSWNLSSEKTQKIPLDTRDWQKRPLEGEDPPEHPLAPEELILPIRQLKLILTNDTQEQLALFAVKLREQASPLLNVSNFLSVAQVAESVGKDDELLKNLFRWLRLLMDVQSQKQTETNPTIPKFREIAQSEEALLALLSILQYSKLEDWKLLRDIFIQASTHSNERDAFLCAQIQASNQSWWVDYLPNWIRERALQCRCQGSDSLIRSLNQFSRTELKTKLDALKPLGLSNDLDDQEITWAGIRLLPFLSHLPLDRWTTIQLWDSKTLQDMLLSLAELAELVDSAPKLTPEETALSKTLFQELYQYYSDHPTDPIVPEYLKNPGEGE